MRTNTLLVLAMALAVVAACAKQVETVAPITPDAPAEGKYK